MKIRNCFVSNSSSSSFVCDVCGNAESGMDASASDFDMSECKNGHYFCNSHEEDIPIINYSQKRELIKKDIQSDKWLEADEKQEAYNELEGTTDEELDDLIDDKYSDYGVFPSQCPICTMSVIRNNDRYVFLRKKFGLTNKEVDDMIREKFKSFGELQEYLKSSNKENKELEE